MAKKQKTEENRLVEFIGESISPESAILAAAINLMRAGDIAKENGRDEILVKVAHAWYAIAKFLNGSSEDDDPERSHPFGFTALETVNGPGDEPHESESGIEVRKKSRQL